MDVPEAAHGFKEYAWSIFGALKTSLSALWIAELWHEHSPPFAACTYGLPFDGYWGPVLAGYAVWGLASLLSIAQEKLVAALGAGKGAAIEHRLEAFDQDLKRRIEEFVAPFGRHQTGPTTAPQQAAPAAAPVQAAPQPAPTATPASTKSE